MALIRLIDQRPASRAIVRSIVLVCRELNIQMIAEGIEREEEMQVLCNLGVTTMQGYFFARPAFEQLPLWHPVPAIALTAEPETHSPA